MDPPAAAQSSLAGIISFFEVHQWIAEPLAVIATGVLATSMIFWQVGKQARAAIELQREASRQSLKVEIYRDFDEIISLATSSGVTAGSGARSLSSDFHLTLSLSRQGLKPYSVKHPVNLYTDNNSNMIDSMHKLLTLLERYQVVNPRLKIFIVAILSASRDIQNAFMEMHETLLRFVPTKEYFADAAAAGFDRQIPTATELATLDTVIKQYIVAVDDYLCYIHDLNIALQNEMLGYLFRNRIPAREVLQSRYKVITLDPATYDDLMKYFNDQTAWGRDRQKAEEDVLQGHAGTLATAPRASD